VSRATACSRPTLAAALAAFAITSLFGSRAAAETTGAVHGLAQLRWNAPRDLDCPSQQQIELAVERHLGRRIFARDGAEAAIQIDARVAREGERFVAVLRTGGRERHLVTAADRCAAVAEPVALVLSLLVDLPAERSILHLPRRADEPWRLQASAGAIGAHGLLPGVSLGGTLAAGLLSPGELLLIEPALSIWAPIEHHELGSGARWSAWSATLAGCARFWRTAALAGKACADAQVGVLQASGLMLEAPLQPTRMWVSLGARLRWELRLSPPFGLSADVGVEFPLRRDAFYYEARGGSRVRLHRAPWLVPLAAFAIFVRWS